MEDDEIVSGVEGSVKMDGCRKRKVCVWCCGDEQEVVCGRGGMGVVLVSDVSTVERVNKN